MRACRGDGFGIEMQRVDVYGNSCILESDSGLGCTGDLLEQNNVISLVKHRLRRHIHYQCDRQGGEKIRQRYRDPRNRSQHANYDWQCPGYTLAQKITTWT